MPSVWIGANEERISYGGHATISAKDSQDKLNVTGSRAGATAEVHPEYPDVTRALMERCGGIVITDDLRLADYAIAIERSHAGHLVTQRNTFSVFRQRNDDLLLSGKTTWLKSAAAEICKTISDDMNSAQSLEGAPPVSAAAEEPSAPFGTGSVAVVSRSGGRGHLGRRKIRRPDSLDDPFTRRVPSRGSQGHRRACVVARSQCAAGQPSYAPVPFSRPRPRRRRAKSVFTLDR